MSGEKSTSLVVLAIAVLCLIVASVFAPRTGVEANAVPQAALEIDDVSNWLFRLAAWEPGEPVAEHPTCAGLVRPSGFWESL
jgi:hypothetical protein